MHAALLDEHRRGTHAYLLDGDVEAWLSSLDRLDVEIDKNATRYVGHGEPRA
ncbi:hypothetical protein BH23ACT10_BH23ACT10_08080 [soil metagenome]